MSLHNAWPDAEGDALVDQLLEYYARVGQKSSRAQLTLIADKYRGKEDTLFKQLERKYHEPVRKAVAVDSADAASETTVCVIPGVVGSEGDAETVQLQPETPALRAIDTTLSPCKPESSAPERFPSESNMPLPTRSVSGRSGLGSDASRQFKDLHEEVKLNIRKNLSKAGPVTTFDRYKTDGVWQKIAKHPIFENVTLGVIVCNALWMGIETDWNKAETLPEAKALFQIMEHSFCTYFTLELFVRFMAFKFKCSAAGDAWFVFDSCLMIMMISEDWILLIVAEATNTKAKFPLGDVSILRLLRLLRLARLMRMLRSMPELMVLVKAMITAIESVLYVLGLLVGVLYVAGILCTQLSLETDMGLLYFGNVAHSMYSLLVYATFLDNLADFCNAIRAESIPVLMVTFLFIFLACLTIMNMLLGILCEVVSEVAATEREQIKFANVSDTLQEVAQQLSLPGTVSPVKFKEIISSKQMLLAFQDVGVDVEMAIDMADMMFFDEEGSFTDLTFDDFLEKVFELRYVNQATVRDIKDFSSSLMPALDKQLQAVEEIKARLSNLEEQAMTVLVSVQKIASKSR